MEARCAFGVLMIRQAQETDLERIVEMGCEFLSHSTYKKFLRESKASMAVLAKQLISKRTLLVSDKGNGPVGMLGYVLHLHFISAQPMAGEIFWWAEPSARGEGLGLLREAEREARASGAKHMQMIAPNHTIAKLYQIRGYEFVESTYQKDL